MSAVSADIARPSGFGDPIHRPNKVEVDLDAIRHNTRIVKGLLGQATKLFGAVKCNGYGLGLPAVAEAMLAGGADGFTLSDPADAISIRRAGVKAPVLLYGGILPAPATIAGLARRAQQWQPRRGYGAHLLRYPYRKDLAPQP